MGDLACRRCSLGTEDHVESPDDLSLEGFVEADFQGETVKAWARRWCLLGLGHPEPVLALVPTSPQ